MRPTRDSSSAAIHPLGMCILRGQRCYFINDLEEAFCLSTVLKLHLKYHDIKSVLSFLITSTNGHYNRLFGGVNENRDSQHYGITIVWHNYCLDFRCCQPTVTLENSISERNNDDWWSVPQFCGILYNFLNIRKCHKT